MDNSDAKSFWQVGIDFGKNLLKNIQAINNR